MNFPLADFWSAPNGSSGLWLGIGATVIVGFALMFLMMQAPPRARRYIVGAFTFVAGLLYVAYYFWPAPQSRGPNDLPVGPVETVSFWLQDAVAAVGDLSNTLTAFLLGLGIYSLVRIHSKRLFSGHRDAFFSAMLLISMILMVIFGYWNWYDNKFAPDAAQYQFQSHWHWWNYTSDFLFNGLLQQMDAAMFSIIAFFILSAAYRAFRIRSIEATVLLATALIVMLSLMGAVEFYWNNGVDSLAHGNAFAQNFRLTEISKWLRDTFQNSGLRALDFGVGLGALAMGLRLWLSLERGGVST